MGPFDGYGEYEDDPDEEREPDFDEDEYELDLEREAREEYWREWRAKIQAYRDLGKTAIRQMLAVEYAVVAQEIVARAGDFPWGDLDLRIDQHHLMAALGELERSGEVVRTPGIARGGREVSVIHQADVTGLKREIERAAGRKRLLDTRYLGWASGSGEGRGVIGPAAERVVHASVLQAAPGPGYQVLNLATGATAEIFGTPVRVGPLDNCVIFNPPRAAEPFVIPVEVKSLRPWIYPRTDKLYQLLYKAAMIVQDIPDVAVVPVLVCRKAHTTTFRMARELGFHVMDTGPTQWLPNLRSIPEPHVVEVRTGLGYVGLKYEGGADKYLVKQFRSVLPERAALIAKRWSQVGSFFAAQYEWLWGHAGEEHSDERNRRVNGLRDEARRLVRALPREDRYEREHGW